MVQAPPKPQGPQIDIELVDLQELARINPVAWEQLCHIVDNRMNAAKISELEATLRTYSDSVYRPSLYPNGNEVILDVFD